VRASGDKQLEQLLDFYRCYRAHVRRKLLSLRLNERGFDNTEGARIADEARSYIDLAHAYAVRVAQPMLLVSMGLPASGKSTLAHGLAARLGLVHLSSDAVRKQLAGLRPTEHLAGAFATGLYSRANTQRTYAALRRNAVQWLRCGQSVVLDATFVQRGERAALRRLARDINARLMVFV
jgi:hypothetical protein